MAESRYEVITHGDTEEKLSVHTLVPSAVIAVIRHVDRNYDFENRRSDARDIWDNNVIQIQDRCIALNTHESKGSHCGGMTCALTDTEDEIATTIAAGDWIMAWITDSDEAALDVSTRVLFLDKANLPTHGLKFVGRVNSIRKSTQKNADGVEIRRVTLNCVSFQEFDSLIYYDPQLLVEDDGTNLSWLPNIAEVDKKFAELQLNSQVATTGQIIGLMLDVFIGVGPSDASEPLNELSRTPNQAYEIPREVARLLGRTSPPSKAGGQYTYADIIASIIGVQKYQGGFNTRGGQWAEMTPIELTAKGGDLRFFTETPLQGVLIPITQPWNAPVWQIMETYLNPAVNEMYTALKVSPEGTILPHFIVRQIPFTNDFFAEAVAPNLSMPVTKFSELPRWVIDPDMVHSFEYGRSDSLRINFAHVLVQTYTNGSEADTLNQQLARVKGDPVPDAEDIRRHGLRPYLMTVSTSPSAFVKSPGKAWSLLAMDRVAAGHIRLSGTMTTSGIVDPICVGDNVEYEGVIYHIEEISHSILLKGGSERDFQTTMSLSMGMPIDDKEWPFPYTNVIVDEAIKLGEAIEKDKLAEEARAAFKKRNEKINDDRTRRNKRGKKGRKR